MHLSTLGPLELRNGDELLLARRRKELVLLAILAQRSPDPVPRRELAELLWEGRDAARARHSLRQALSELHRALGDALMVDGEAVALAPGSVALDASEFMAACAREEWDAAIGMWRGEFLEQADDVGGARLGRWLGETRATLRARLSTACERRVLDAERNGRWTMALPHARAWLRHAPGDPAVKSKLAALLRTVGRRSEADRVDRLERDAMIGLREADFVGRERELELLTRMWHAVRSGEWRVAVVRGPAGSGRTRLLREFARLVAERWPRSTVARVTDAPVAVMSSSGAALPETPTLLVADASGDAEVADAMSSILSRAPRGTLLLVAAGPAGFPRLDRSAAYLQLEPLSVDDTRCLTRSMVPLPERLLEPLTRRLHADTGGHAADLVRAVTLLVDEAMIVPDPAGGWTTTRGVAIAPLAIDDPRERTRRRLERMRAESRRAVDAAAVLGIAATRELIASLAGLAGPGLDAALQEATARRLLRAGPDGRFRFHTEVVREAVYGLIPEARVRKLHRAAAHHLRRAAREDARLRAELRRHREVAGLGFGRRWRLVEVLGLGVRS